MIIRDKADLVGGPNHSQFQGGTSVRHLTRVDGVGFSLHDTFLEAGTSLTLEYKNHIEANLCIEGNGEVQDLTTNEVFSIHPGVSYTLDKHDRHKLTAITDLRLICVFNPAVVGTEKHDADGSYPLI